MWRTKEPKKITEQQPSMKSSRMLDISKNQIMSTPIEENAIGKKKKMTVFQTLITLWQEHA